MHVLVLTENWSFSWSWSPYTFTPPCVNIKNEQVRFAKCYQSSVKETLNNKISFLFCYYGGSAHFIEIDAYQESSNGLLTEFFIFFVRGSSSSAAHTHPDLLIDSMPTDQIGLHSVLLPLLITDLFRPRSHVSWYFWIRNCFFPDTTSTFSRVNPDTIRCLWAGELDLNTLRIDRKMFWIPQKGAYSAKISGGYVTRGLSISRAV